MLKMQIIFFAFYLLFYDFFSKFAAMCYRPLHIKNTSLRFDCNCDKLIMQVPCGKCGECRQAKQDSVAARIYYEYLYTVKCEGYVFFQTFTYNEDHVPTCHGIKCFDSRHYTLFMKNLRNDLKRYAKEHDLEFIPKVKVYWVCEYGGLTYRPHYHSLFFIIGNISPDDFAKLTERNWCICHNWLGEGHSRESLGFCDTNNPDPSKRHTPSQRVVDGMGALGYVSKYVCKDLDFLDVLEKQLNGHYDGEEITDEDKKYMMPFTRQSNGIGECMTDMLTIDDLMDGRVTIPDNLQGSKVIALPQYIDRKVFYEYNPEDKCFRLSQKGLEMKKHRRLHNRDYITKQVEWLLGHIGHLWTPEVEDKLHMSPADAMVKCSDILYNRRKDFIDYIIYYKDISSTYLQNVQYVDDLAKFAEDFICRKVPNNSPHFCLSELKDDDPHYYRYLFDHTYNRKSSRFRGFEDVLMIFNEINLSFCNKQQQLYLKRQEEKSRRKYTHSLYR